jgi:hypothetical protein
MLIYWVTSPPPLARATPKSQNYRCSDRGLALARGGGVSGEQQTSEILGQQAQATPGHLGCSETCGHTKQFSAECAGLLAGCGIEWFQPPKFQHFRSYNIYSFAILLSGCLSYAPAQHEIIFFCKTTNFGRVCVARINIRVCILPDVRGPVSAWVGRRRGILANCTWEVPLKEEENVKAIWKVVLQFLGAHAESKVQFHR